MGLATARAQRSERSVRPERVRRIDATHATLASLAAVVALWAASLARIDLSAMGAYGLVSALPVTMYAGLALLTLSMVLAIHRNERTGVLVAHLVLFVLMVHATPALLYGTLRYEWAWKHLGLIDYLSRHHIVDPSAGDLRVYQNWPGFFTTTTSWLVGAGLQSWAGIVQWAPPVFELLFAFAALALLSAVETDRRVVWLAVWFFAIANWVGQDYFSPQAFACFLYLAVLTVVFRFLVRRPAMPSFVRRFVRRGFEPEIPEQPRLPSREQTRAAVLVIVLCVTAIATSHPLTPILLFLALSLLTITRVVRIKTLPFLASLPTFLWLDLGARTYTRANTAALLKSFGAVDNNLNQNLTKAAHAVASQHVVSLMGRVEVLFVAGLALIGIVRRIRVGRWDVGMLALAVVPLTIVAGNSYGGEAVFRAFLFALPFLAYFAAAGFYPTPDSGSRRSILLELVACGVIIVAFLFAYYGKEQWSYFTRGEVRAAEVVFDKAQPNSLLVDGTPDYPNRFANYNDFTYVDIASEPPSSYNKVLADPANELYKWLADGRYSQAYLIITASQKAEIDALGGLPAGSLDKIENALLLSPKFQVLYHDADAVVFTVPRVTAPAR